MPVSGRSAGQSALRYIDKIAEFKRAVRAGLTDTPGFRENEAIFRRYYAEGGGRRRGARAGYIDYLSRHGDVVDALHTWRLEQGLAAGERLVKNVLIDLGLAVNADLHEVFEVKTGVDRSNLYGAIGQLMVHGVRPGCKRILVLPEGLALPNDVHAALARMSIKLQRFRLSERTATIL